MNKAVKIASKLLLTIGILIMPFIFSWFTLKKGTAKKYKILAFGWLILFGVLLIIGIMNPQQQKPLFTVNKVSVSNFEYTINAQPAVNITFQQSNNSYCELTLLRSDIEQGFSIISEKNNTNNISASCSFNGELYVQSSKHPTKTSIYIEKINSKEKEASFKVSLKLINSKTLEEYIEIKNVIFTALGQEFLNLTTTPQQEIEIEISLNNCSYTIDVFTDIDNLMSQIIKFRDKKASYKEIAKWRIDTFNPAFNKISNKHHLTPNIITNSRYELATSVYTDYLLRMPLLLGDVYQAAKTGDYSNVKKQSDIMKAVIPEIRKHCIKEKK